mmetsp:Transcript_40065/g.65149  ORF Transcript_40065/g.65149 Transcript_40065/m.65149 type:complete len:466 (+) Transcript_40065:145-1542(+)
MSKVAPGGSGKKPKRFLAGLSKQLAPIRPTSCPANTMDSKAPQKSNERKNTKDVEMASTKDDDNKFAASTGRVGHVDPDILRSFTQDPDKMCHGCGKCYIFWINYKYTTSALDREDVKAMLDMLLIVFTLVLSFSVAHMFVFEPEHLREADQRHLEHVLGLNATEAAARLDHIYSKGGDTMHGQCNWYSANRAELLGGSDPPFGDWNQNMCDGLDKKLPSYQVFESSSISIALVGTVLFLGITMYLVLIMCKPLEDPDTYQDFIALTFPVLIYMIILGLAGIFFFFFSLEYGTTVSFPRLNAGDVFYNYYGYIIICFVFPAAGYIIASAVVLYFCHKERELGDDADAIELHETQLTYAKLHKERLIEFAFEPVFLNELLKDAGIKVPGERLEIIYMLREEAIHRQRKYETRLPSMPLQRQSMTKDLTKYTAKIRNSERKKHDLMVESVKDAQTATLSATKSSATD